MFKSFSANWNKTKLADKVFVGYLCISALSLVLRTVSEIKK